MPLIAVTLTDEEVQDLSRSRSYERPPEWYESPSDRALARYYRAARAASEEL
jgi:hypothetical protein